MNLDMDNFREYCSHDINSMYPRVMDIKSIEKKLNEKYRMRVMNKKYWPYQVVVEPLPNTYISDNPDRDPRVAWLDQRINRGVWKRHGWSSQTYVFKREADAVMFALKWK